MLTSKKFKNFAASCPSPPRKIINLLTFFFGLFSLQLCHLEKTNHKLVPAKIASTIGKEETLWPPLPFEKPYGPVKSKGEIGLFAGGDVMLDWGIREVISKYGYSYPVKNIKPLVDVYDLAVCNLETPITSDCEIAHNKLYTFVAPPSFLSAIKILGIDGVMLANNHIGDCAYQGMLDTVNNLSKFNIDYAGFGKAGAPQEKKHIHFEIAGEKISILAFGIKTLEKDRPENNKGIGVYYPHEDELKNDIIYYRETSDYLVVSLHWGTEYTEMPSRKQRKLARKIIDLGADAVIGHHSHWVQGIEHYKSGIIIYSLGNFIFGSNNKFLRNGYVAGLIFGNKLLNRVEIYPINTKNKNASRFRPEFLKGAQAKKMLLDVQRLSKRFKTRINIQRGFGTIRVNKPRYYKLNHHFRWKMESKYKRLYNKKSKSHPEDR